MIRQKRPKKIDNISHLHHVDTITVAMSPEVGIKVDRNSVQLFTVEHFSGSQQIVVQYESDDTYKIIQSHGVNMSDYTDMAMNRDMMTGRSTGILHSVKDPFGGGWKHVYTESRGSKDWYWKCGHFVEGPSLCPQGETLQQISWAPQGDCLNTRYSDVEPFKQALKNESSRVHSENNAFNKILKENGLRMKDPCEIHHLSKCIHVSDCLMVLMRNPGPAKDYIPDVSKFTPGSIGHIVYEMMILCYHHAVYRHMARIERRSTSRPVPLQPSFFVKILLTKKRFDAINERFLKSKLEFKLSGCRRKKAYLF